MVYADGIDIISADKIYKGKVINTINNLFPERCLMIKHSLIKRGHRNTEIWRSVKKYVSLLEIMRTL